MTFSKALIMRLLWLRTWSQKNKALIMRLLWFVVGGVVSISLNAGLFRFFHFYVGWNRFLAYGLALGIANIVLFTWNYFVGFRTRRQWVGSAWRHAVCLSVANALDYTLVVILHGIFPQWPSVVIAVVKIFVSGFKFGAYHYWVYPERARDPASPGAGKSVGPVDDALPPRAN
jgi:hypothetical protein